MLDEAIAKLQEKHPWMKYEEGFALMVDAYERHLPQNKYSGMTKTLVEISFGIFLREDEYLLRNRLARISEFM